MKKVLISVLLVLLTLCLFVSCKNEPKVEGNCTVYKKTMTVWECDVHIVVCDDGTVYDFVYDLYNKEVLNYWVEGSDYFTIDGDTLTTKFSTTYGKFDRGVVTINNDKLTLTIGGNTIYSNVPIQPI